MIFATVGTHEQQFNRLIKEIDRLKGENLIKDNVIIQTGYSTYKPKYCEWSKLFSYEQMNANIEQARIVITHGGPASFIAPLQIGKIPIVVPRQKKFGEHVNNHQLEFCRIVDERLKNIILVDDIETIQDVIMNYEKICNEKVCVLNNNNNRFVEKLEQRIKDMWERK